MKASFSSHISEDLLERYALHQLDGAQLATVEEHLLICSVCQDHLDRVDEYIKAVKLAAFQVRERKDTPRGWLPDMSRIPVAARLLAATVTIAAVALIVPWRGRNFPYHEVTLKSTRGGGGAIPLAEAPAAGSLTLKMDVSEIGRSSGYQIYVVNSAGLEIWRGRGEANHNQLSIAVPVNLSAGTYWVRLFDISQPPVLLREYGLELW